MRAVLSTGRMWSLRARSVYYVLIAFMTLNIAYLLIPSSLLVAKLTLAFLVVFIIPGLCFTLLFKRLIESILWLLTESFFISTILVALITIASHALGFRVSQVLYAALSTVMVILALIRLWMKLDVEISVGWFELISLLLTFLTLIIFLQHFTSLERVFTPDGVSYSFMARAISNEGVIISRSNPLETRGIIRTLTTGYFLWPFLLYAFMVSTGSSPHLIGIINLYFFIMTSLTSLLLVKRGIEWLKPLCLITILSTPILIMFSAVALNDMAIAFYAMFSISLLDKALISYDKKQINIRYAIYAFVPSIIITLIKPNLLVTAVIWLVLVCIMTWNRLYEVDRAHRLFYAALIIPVLLYEMIVDIPYILSLCVLRDVKISSVFARFLIVSPVWMLTRLFYKPWWKTVGTTLFEQHPLDILERLYLVLSPEMSGLFISSVVISLFFFSLYGKISCRERALFYTLTLALVLFSLQAMGPVPHHDIVRYSLWMRFFFVPTSLSLVTELLLRRDVKKLNTLSIFTCLLVYANSLITNTKGGTLIGYAPLFRSWTLSSLLLQLLIIILILCIANSLLTKLRFKLCIRRLTHERQVSIVPLMLCSLIIVTVIFNIKFASIFMSRTCLYEDHHIQEMMVVLNKMCTNGSLVFTNVYALRPYVNNDMFKYILPMPAVRENLSALIQAAPEDTYFLISDDFTISWFDYATWFNDTESYAMNLASLDYITSRINDIMEFDIRLPDPVLYFNFSNLGSSTIVPDLSGHGNDGINHGVRSIRWKRGQAAIFDGHSYISVNNSDLLCANDAIAISFYAFINDTWESQVLLSKGYVDWGAVGNFSGSYMVQIFKDYIYFVLGGEFYGTETWTPMFRITSKGVFLRAPIKAYANDWHHFFFTFNGTSMSIFIDGEQVAHLAVSGRIRITPYDLNIGRESSAERTRYFKGMLAELQISTLPLDSYSIVTLFHKHFAKRIYHKRTQFGAYALFKVEHTVPLTRTKVGVGNVSVKSVILALKHNLCVKIALNVYTSLPGNITIIISTHRYSHVFSRNLSPGNNVVLINYAFVEEPVTRGIGGPWWRYLTWARILVIYNRKLIFNKLVSLVHAFTVDMALIAALTVSIILGPLTPLVISIYTPRKVRRGKFKR